MRSSTETALQIFFALVFSICLSLLFTFAATRIEWWVYMIGLVIIIFLTVPCAIWLVAWIDKVVIKVDRVKKEKRTKQIESIRWNNLFGSTRSELPTDVRRAEVERRLVKERIDAEIDSLLIRKANAQKEIDDARDRIHGYNALLVQYDPERFGDHDEAKCVATQEVKQAVKPFEVKEGTHIVIKKADGDKYLTSNQISMIVNLLNKIEVGRMKDGKKPNDYYVINKDEPYAHIILDVIRHGETEMKP